MGETMIYISQAISRFFCGLADRENISLKTIICKCPFPLFLFLSSFTRFTYIRRLKGREQKTLACRSCCDKTGRKTKNYVFLLLPSHKELNNEIYVKYGNNIFCCFLFTRILTYTERKQKIFLFCFVPENKTLQSEKGRKKICFLLISLDWWRKFSFCFSLTVLILRALCDQVCSGMIEN